MTLDSILNVVIPAGIVIAIIVFIYSKGKKHIDKFFRMVKGWFEPKEEGGVEDDEKSLNYRIDYRGAEY